LERSTFDAAPRPHLAVGEPERDGQEVRHEAPPRLEPPRPGQLCVAGVVGEEAPHGLDHDLARDLAALVAAHAIGDDEDPELLVEQHRVFVVGAAPDVRAPRRLDAVPTRRPPRFAPDWLCAHERAAQRSPCQRVVRRRASARWGVDAAVSSPARPKLGRRRPD